MTVQYEVSLDCRPELAEPLERYMREIHIPEIWATGCFAGIQFHRSSPTRIRTTYVADDRPSLDLYLTRYSPGLRQDFGRRFPEGVVPARSIWEPVQTWGDAPRAAAPATESLAGEIERAHGGGAWHGPSLGELLTAIEANAAASRPIATAHTIWEIVLHCTAWVREVTRRLGRVPSAEPEMGDWPAVTATTPAAWHAARTGLAREHAALIAAIRAFPAAHWADRVGVTLDLPLGTGRTYAETVTGLAQHDAYHGGQIALLAKATA